MKVKIFYYKIHGNKIPEKILNIWNKLDAIMPRKRFRYKQFTTI